MEVNRKRTEDFEELMRGNPCTLIGTVKKEPKLTVHGMSGKKLVETELTMLRKAWKTPLEAIEYEN